MFKLFYVLAAIVNGEMVELKLWTFTDENYILCREAAKETPKSFCTVTTQ